MIDLHMHTNHSDGTDSVEELLKNAEKQNLELISITDHDQVSAYYELEENPSLRNLFSGKIMMRKLYINAFVNCARNIVITPATRL